MLRIASFIFLFLSLQAQAESIHIQGPNFLQAGKYQQYKVMLNKDDGTQADITNQVSYQASNVYFRRVGEVLFAPGYRGYSYQTKLQAQFKTVSGVLSDVLTINIDSTPFSISIYGPNLVYFGSTTQYFANAQFMDMRFDITQQCEWQSFYGLIYSNGVYRAPVYGNPVVDTLGCRFGNFNQSNYINIVR
jgi:hypothetical protein